MSVLGEKYEAYTKHGEDKDYKRHMFLKIRKVNRTDFGSYQCVAKNSLGETGGQIKLEGKMKSSSNIYSHIYGIL